jgi:RNA polymerase subunit RPABC4/transcription elongation factor Spt4
MFEIKKCKRCGKGLKDDWVACPYCGQEARERRPYNIFNNIDKEFERIDKMFGPVFVKFPKTDIESPFKGGGISIVIKSCTGMKPKIDVKNFGDYKKFEPEIKRRLGVREGVEGVKEEKIVRRVRIPKITEEPEIKIDKVGNKETISIKLPDVKNPDDIEIRKLEQSIEIKAFAGDKAYFKLIPIKPNAEIFDRNFKNGVLKIEVSG